MVAQSMLKPLKCSRLSPPCAVSPAPSAPEEQLSCLGFGGFKLAYALSRNYRFFFCCSYTPNLSYYLGSLHSPHKLPHMNSSCLVSG